MKHQRIKEAYQEQEHDRLLQVAAKDRMLSQAQQSEDPLPEEKEVRVMLTRSLVFTTAILIALLLLTVTVVAAAGFATIGGGYWVM